MPLGNRCLYILPSISLKSVIIILVSLSLRDLSSLLLGSVFTASFIIILADLVV